MRRESVVASRLSVRGRPARSTRSPTASEPTILFAPHFYGLDAAATALTMHTARPSTTIYTTQRDPMVDEWVTRRPQALRQRASR